MKRGIVLPVYTRKEEILNMTTHILGGAFGIVALFFCLFKSFISANPWAVVGSFVYGISIILLFTMSSIYHGLIPVKAKKVFRVIDHCTIYLLIAGTYTPIVLVSLRVFSPFWAWLVFGIVWGSAIFAITLTAIDMYKFRVFSMISYLAMGWCILIALKPLLQVMAMPGFALLLAGGIGAVLGVGGTFATHSIIKKKRAKVGASRA